ncbi:hypothetical protein Athai_39220 [Actinocatenispora thailandica]|uniref:DoxX family protein n=1 Tax=Actinocatenispora thailandica TaxID=227318 RepID=A0A7R7DRE4_9ACTN|nr:DoxX-like family protein [Actinocatenispora thailandica]BCJ36419.1 hypothetical protein Athai_39220 [Actinocatenispora thailandica]
MSRTRSRLDATGGRWHGTVHRVAAVTVTLVWWYEGSWEKILAGSADQRAIVASVPWLPASLVSDAVLAIGIAEIGLGLWVLTGVRPRLAALAQTTALVAFNAGGLAFGHRYLTQPAAMLARNVTFLALCWLVALSAGRSGRRP